MLTNDDVFSMRVRGRESSEGCEVGGMEEWFRRGSDLCLGFTTKLLKMNGDKNDGIGCSFIIFRHSAIWVFFCDNLFVFRLL